MLTTPDAAALLQRATHRTGRVALLRTLSFVPPAGALDPATATRLGLDDTIVRAEVAAGPGTLRALLVETHAGASLRDAVSRAARRVAARSPELLWLLIAHSRGGEVAIAVPAPGGSDGTGAMVVDVAHVRPGDAETFAALVAATGTLDLDTHLRWREVLGRDALTRRFYRDLESTVHALANGAQGSAPDDARHALALRCVSRLLFLSFLEAKGWLDDDRAFLSRQVAARGTQLHRTLLEPLFFGTLNAPYARRAAAARAFGRLPFLNGGLFTRDALEKRHRHLRFADADIAHVVGALLARYRVTAHEGSPGFSEAAVDPEMLGRAFESLMVSEDRRNTGAFYTPPTLIAHIFDQALDAAMPSDECRTLLNEARAGRVRDAAGATRLRSVLSDLRILDPACGTGAFLVHALVTLARLLENAHDARAEHVRRREVLARSIFGVDINPTAVWLCELRLWLAVVVDMPERDPMRVPPLPNLDRNIRCADALAGPAFDDPRGTDAGTARLRDRYARATGPRKQALQRQLDRAERELAVDGTIERITRNVAQRRDLVCALRGRDLFGRRRAASSTERATLDAWRAEARALRRALGALRSGGAVPFGFATHFGDVARRGGFDLVIGNPPWVRLHRIPPTERDRLRASYVSFRNAAWRAGAAASGALTGFAMQADLAALFTERAVALARPAGAVALLIPSKLFRSLAGGGLRSVLRQSAALLACEDHAEGRAMFDAATYPAVLVLQRNGGRMPRAAAAPQGDVACAVVRRDTAIRWRSPFAALPLDATEGAPWLLLPAPARAAFDALLAHGTPLAESPFGRPLLGVKSGCNDAFVVRPSGDWRLRASGAVCDVASGEQRGAVERALLRPVLRGEDLVAFEPRTSGAAIIWTHDAARAPLRSLPPHTARWLAHWRITLGRRTDARTNDRWWSLFRLDAATAAWRVVWGDVGRTPRAAVLAPDDPTVPLNSCYVVNAPSAKDADALAAWLNAPLATAWLAAVAEPARGGYRRFLGWTMARLPVPQDWPAARALLAPVGAAARQGSAPAASELHDLSLRAFRLPSGTVEPLLTWMHL